MLALFAALDGTLLNAATVLLGGALGAILGDRLPQRIRESLFGVLGLFTLLIGLQDAFTTRNPLIMLGALLLGTLLGETLDLERRIGQLGDWAQTSLARTGGGDRLGAVSEAFVTASLLFCVGPLSILGALENGLTGDITKLAIKATLDGFAALAFGATLGPGVLLAIITILLYQGGISLGAQGIRPLLSAHPGALTELTATGGVLLVAIGLKLLKLRDLRVANMLPALLFAPILVAALALAQRLPTLTPFPLH